ncbi:MAG: hypothetical protein ACREBD_29135 [Blastocatellia bacterium]
MAASALSLLTARVEALEAEVTRLKGQANGVADSDLPWWEKRWGMFDNDPDYDKAMELGRKYRESLRPKSSKKGARKKSAKKSAKARKG